MRKNGSMSFLLSDHLGSTSITTDAAGTKTSELRYSPWGEVRFSSSANPGLPTDYTFTGQYSYMDDPTTNGAREGFGLMFYNARWYDPALGRFAQADTIIPEQSQGTQAWDRYAYVNNNPVRYNDPTGHCPWCVGAGVGLIVGGIVGGVTYAITNQGNIDYGELALATGAGAVSGALIGSGIGLVAGAVAASGSAVTIGAGAAAVATASSTATPLIAAGVASGVTEIQYMADNPGGFESDPFVVNAGISGVTAFASAKTQDPFSKIIIEGGGAGIAYLATSDPESFYWEDLGASVSVGVAGGIFDAGFGFGLEKLLWITALQKPLVNTVQGLVTGTIVGRANNYVLQNVVKPGRTEEMR